MANKKVEGFVEQVWFVYGYNIGPFSIGYLDYQNDGEVCEVKFNLARAFFGKNTGKRNDQRLLGFYHSHPGGDPYPSPTDCTTMDAWVKASGRPLLCGIFSGEKQKCFLYDRISPGSPKVDFKQCMSKIHFDNRIVIVNRSKYLYLSK
jgi:hypothetical protein